MKFKFIQTVRLFWRNRRGVAAVEAALVLPIMVPVMILTLEVLLFIFYSVSLDSAVREASRKMKIGAASGDIADIVCERMPVPSCKASLKVELLLYDTLARFERTSTAVPDPSKLAMLRAQYPLPMVLLTSQVTGTVISAKSAYLFQTEPY
jgi:Flp pilus assembly pilin Flp